VPPSQSSKARWNMGGIGVFACSWLAARWQFSVWHAGGLDVGRSATEAEAWERARKIGRFHRALPQGETP
jgi:hypothetical protein